jgi:hypothetical protein
LSCCVEEDAVGKDHGEEEGAKQQEEDQAKPEEGMHV